MSIEGLGPLSMSSAYVGKLSLLYGQFHISGSTMSLAPLRAASCRVVINHTAAAQCLLYIATEMEMYTYWNT
jgi:hypothetical protein